MRGKPKPKPDTIEELPDAWERFERAFDTVMKAKPMPRKAPKVANGKPRRGGPRGLAKAD
jgi:hypothetical protein